MNTIKPEICTVDIGDAEIQYLHYKGGTKTIIFLHATGFLPWLWDPIARHFAGEYTVIAPYFCDHREANHETGLSWMTLAEDLCTFCEKLKLYDPYLVGHSMGGAIIALAEVIHGSMAKKMVLIEPIFLPEQIYSIGLTVEQHPLAAKAIKRKNFWSSREEAQAYFTSKALFAQWDKEMLDIYVNYGLVPGETGGFILACPPKREVALFMGSGLYNPWPLIPKIKCPVLVLEGEKSENKSFIEFQKIASLIPNGKYQLVSGAGHLIPMEKPLETVSIIREFFISE